MLLVLPEAAVRYLIKLTILHSRALYLRIGDLKKTDVICT